MRSKHLFFVIILFLQTFNIYSQTTNIGSGSYTNSFPGKDSANRNDYPTGSPQVTGIAANKPVPTNDWWSKAIKENHADNLFNYPLAMKTKNSGLQMSYIPFGVMGDGIAFDVTLSGLDASQAKVSDHSDWTVTLDWQNNAQHLNATLGIGMPFVYFTKDANSEVKIEINIGQATISNEKLLIDNSINGSKYVVYAPTGSSWTQNGNTYASNLDNKNYWSVVMLPQNTNDINQKANAYQKYAYVFPINTEANWNFNESTSVLRTDFTVTAEVKEGSNTSILQGLLPHQWGHLASDSTQPNIDVYDNVRGDLKMLEGNSFSVENSFKGILPTLPYLANLSDSFSPTALGEKIDLIENDGLSTWTDSYNEGQMMNRLIQTARIADQTGDTAARDKIVTTVKERLEDWLKYQSGEVAFLFYYNDTWTTLFGYPAGHMQDSNINDHHFHWGYFIHAAAFVEQFSPGWANDWGDMVNLLVRDAASYDRDDNLFPFLRNFSPYAGHAWANGFATFPQGNDQESTSESMQFNSSLIHWGTITGNDTIRDLGIYLYTTEKTAVDEYWFDVNDQVFADNYTYNGAPLSVASRVWGNSYDAGTFWTADIAAAYGIELYPIHGGSLYLGHNTAFASNLWNEMATNTGIMGNEENNNLWHDVYWEFAALTDPDAAIALYDSYPDRGLKFGISDAQTYHWIHNMKAMGQVDASVTANYPIAAVFNNNNDLTYVAHNYSANPITVTFSDGFELEVPARTIKTNKDTELGGTINTNFDTAHTGGSINLSIEPTGSGVTQIEVYKNGDLIETLSEAPYTLKVEGLTAGIHNFYAKVFANASFGITNAISVSVGDQVPYLGTPFAIPGTIDAGYYDVFEGGLGQNITYFDATLGNNGGEYGDFRLDEHVDAVFETEGATVGWLDDGEWLTYTVNVTQSGYYDVDIRYATENTSSGPLQFEIDGNAIGNTLSFSSTGEWDQWSSKTLQNVPLTEGTHVLRLNVIQGGFNIGKMTFSFDSALDYSPLIADAGESQVVQLPATTSQLSGSASSIPNPNDTSITWSQLYGPTTVGFDDITIINPTVSNLEAGIYKFKLSLVSSNQASTNEVLVIVQEGANSLPTVSISSPEDGAVFVNGDNVLIRALASDIDGEITSVKFYNGNTLIGEKTSSPYEITLNNLAIGNHTITAEATDNDGASVTSNPINITVNLRQFCTFTDSSSIDGGGFSTGYTITFETIGNSVKISTELLDTDKQGVVALLFRQSPFSESYMDHDGGLTFSKTVGGYAVGETISYAIKFAYAGGLSVTSYFQYEVGSTCELNTVDLNLDNQIVMYPNPFNESIHITINQSNTFESLAVYDINGKQLISRNVSDLNQLTIDTNALQSGLYFISIKSQRGTVITKKLIKHK